MADKCTISKTEAHAICQQQRNASWYNGIPFVGGALAAKQRNKLTADQKERRKKLADLKTQLDGAKTKWQAAINTCATDTADNLIQ